MTELPLFVMLPSASTAYEVALRSGTGASAAAAENMGPNPATSMLAAEMADPATPRRSQDECAISTLMTGIRS
jgi:hypothetical protein